MSAIQLHQLNPTEAVIVLNDTEYTLRKFDLLARTWAYNEFATDDEPNGLMALGLRMHKFAEDHEPILKCCWQLLKRKRDFGSYESFVKAVDVGDSKSKGMQKVGELLRAFNQTMGAAELTEADVQEDLDLKKS